MKDYLASSEGKGLLRKRSQQIHGPEIAFRVVQAKVECAEWRTWGEQEADSGYGS